MNLNSALAEKQGGNEMKNISKLLAGTALCLSLSVSTAIAQVVTVATGAQGSIAFNSGQAVAKVANEAGITARTQPIVGYIPLINSGEIDFGFNCCLNRGKSWPSSQRYIESYSKYMSR